MWGKALAFIAEDGWCSDTEVTAAVRVHVSKVAVAGSMLEAERVKQPQTAFRRRPSQKLLEVSSVSLLCYAFLGAALLCVVHAGPAVPAGQLKCSRAGDGVMCNMTNNVGTLAAMSMPALYIVAVVRSTSGT